MAGHRGHNEGTITKRTDGRWEARMSLPSGKRKSFYGKTRQEVQRKLLQAQRDLEKRMPIVGECQTLAQYLEVWFGSAKHRIKPNTHNRYRYSMDNRIIPALGNVPLARLTAQHVQALYNAKLDAGYAASTVLNIHVVIHSALKEAVRLGLAQRNVADLVQKPRRRRTSRLTFTEDQVRIFLTAVRGHRLEALFLLAISTGMREGELLGLSWSDVDLEKGLIQVSRSLQVQLGTWKMALSEPKTSHSQRRILLSDAARRVLCEHRERQQEERRICGELWDTCWDLVFTNTIGRPIHGPHLRFRMFHPILMKAGLPRIRFHDLRHTAATLLLRRGVHPKIVSEMLGHANVSITLDTYSHVTPDMQGTAAQAMNTVLTSGQ